MIFKNKFGDIDGKEVALFTLRNNNGDEVSISDYGGIITSWTVKDKNDKRDNIIIGFDHLDHYLPNDANFGALIGRYANRIGNAKFTIDGKEYQLSRNEGHNQLHGGNYNFSKVIWEASVEDDGAWLVLTHTSENGNEGFPGNLTVKVSFRFSDDNELSIAYTAITDQPTHVNFTSHPYFNLSGDYARDISGHILKIEAAHFTPVDKQGIPTGEIMFVENTFYDFRFGKKIGTDIVRSNGYDHNFVLDQYNGNIRRVAILEAKESGRVLEVFTDQPGLQLYIVQTSDRKTISDKEKGEVPYAAVCLETQHFPDTPNHAGFPSTLLKPGMVFNSVTKYRASIKSYT